jgi:hypothetical protein
MATGVAPVLARGAAFFACGAAVGARAEVAAAAVDEGEEGRQAESGGDDAQGFDEGRVGWWAVEGTKVGAMVRAMRGWRSFMTMMSWW